MGKKTAIQWALFPGYQSGTWNPFHASLKPEFQIAAEAAGHKPRKGWFCEKVVGADGKLRLGCAHCYAEAANVRMGNGLLYQPNQARKLDFVLDALDLPRRTKKPTSWFVDSMTDLFLEHYTDAQIKAVMDEMLAVERHVYIVLTKRPERQQAFMAQYFPDLHKWPNILLGVSCEDQKSANEMLPYLLATNCASRVVSYEPAVGPVDWDQAHWGMDVLGQPFTSKAVDWFLIGGESRQRSNKPAPFDVAWAIDTIAWAKTHGSQSFVKQMGSNAYFLGQRVITSDSHGGDNMAEWPVESRVREFPVVTA